MAGAALFPVAPAAAEDNGWSISVSIPNWVWTSYGCNEVPVTITATGQPADWTVILPVRLSGSGHFSDTVMASGVGAGSETDSINLCPSDLNGTYLASGMARGGVPESRPKLEAQFTVGPMASNTALAQVDVSRTKTRFTGWVSATSATLGSIGGKPGTIVEIQRQSASGWSKVGSGKVDNLGNYSISVSKTYPGGTLFRAHYVGATEVAESTSDPLSSPAAVPTKPKVLRVVLGSGKALVTWRSQGPSVTYKYRIAASGKAYSDWVTTPGTSARFIDLVPRKKYRVQLAAASVSGTSATTKISFRSR